MLIRLTEISVKLLHSLFNFFSTARHFRGEISLLPVSKKCHTRAFLYLLCSSFWFGCYLTARIDVLEHTLVGFFWQLWPRVGKKKLFGTAFVLHKMLGEDGKIYRR